MTDEDKKYLNILQAFKEARGVEIAADIWTKKMTLEDLIAYAVMFETDVVHLEHRPFSKSLNLNRNTPSYQKYFGRKEHD